MAEFLTGNNITSAIENMFKEAEECILICSPYIKLHPHIKNVLQHLEDKPYCKLIVVFGKNEQDLSKSLHEEDFNFLRSLPCVEIKHEPRLHAKYYASEKEAILSSMNLYEFSHNNNIEFGVKTKYNALKRLGKSLGANGDLDEDAEKFFMDVEKRAKLVYCKEPLFKKKLAGLRQSYEGSEVKIDELSRYYKRSAVSGYSGYSHRGQREEPAPKPVVEHGYCIRSGEPIPFNLERPMSERAFSTWAKFGDEHYAERYCHYSGEESEGQTSYAKPVLRKYWREANR